MIFQGPCSESGDPRRGGLAPAVGHVGGSATTPGQFSGGDAYQLRQTQLGFPVLREPQRNMYTVFLVNIPSI